MNTLTTPHRARRRRSARTAAHAGSMRIASQLPASDRGVGPSGLERRWWTLLAVCGASFMLLIDITIVQVALPTIQRHLGGSFTDLQWVIDAYALTLAAFILTFGSLADRFGRKTVFVGGVVLFTSASVVCGAANSAALLIGARALQGFGGAAMFATGLALIGQEFQGLERGKAIAAWSATVGVALAAGPLLGGGRSRRCAYFSGCSRCCTRGNKNRRSPLHSPVHGIRRPDRFHTGRVRRGRPAVGTHAGWGAGSRRGNR